MSDNIFIRHKGEIKEDLINLKKEVIIDEDIEKSAYIKQEKDKESKATYELTAENNEYIYFTFFSAEGIKVHAYTEDKEIDCTANGLTNVINFGKCKVRY